MSVAKTGDILMYVLCVLFNCYSVVTQMLPRRYSCDDGLYINYNSKLYDCNDLTPSQNQNRSTCAQACVTCAVIPTKQKRFQKIYN